MHSSVVSLGTQCWILDALGFIFLETSEVSWDREEMICQGSYKLDLPRLKTDIEMQWVFISIQHIIVGKNAAFFTLESLVSCSVLLLLLFLIRAPDWLVNLPLILCLCCGCEFPEVLVLWVSFQV